MTLEERLARARTNLKKLGINSDEPIYEEPNENLTIDEQLKLSKEILEIAKRLNANMDRYENKRNNNK